MVYQAFRASLEHLVGPVLAVYQVSQVILVGLVFQVILVFQALAV